MSPYSKAIEVRWADLDPNFHMLHSRYYDLGAYVRMSYLVELGLTPEKFQKLMIGPILLKEECVFRREIRFGDKIEIDLVLTKAKKDGSRFSFRHRIFRNSDQIAATIQVDLAWIDLNKRKLAIVPEDIAETLLQIPRSEDFVWQ